MKKYLFSLLYILSNCFAYGQNVNVIQVNENNEMKHSYLVSCVDSLIHDLDRRLQILYIGGETYEYNIEEIDSVSFGKEDVKVFYLPNYIEGTETYFFSNGCAVNISEDSINGYTVFVDSLDFKANKWDEDKALALYCDSLFRPIMAVSNNGKLQFIYQDTDNTFSIKIIDSNGNVFEITDISIQNSYTTRSYNLRRASTDGNWRDGANNALRIVNLTRSVLQRDMNGIYAELLPDLVPQGIPRDIGSSIAGSIGTYFETNIYGRALGLVGLVLTYTQLISDLRDWIVKQEIGNITPKIYSLEQFDNGSVDLRIEFSGDGFLSSTNDAPLFHINYWQEVDGRKVGFTHSTSSQNANYGLRTERISNLNGGNWAFQVIVYPSRFSVSDFLVANYNFRSNIMRTDMGRIYISELSQTSDYYSDNTVTLSMRASLKYQSDEDEVILSAYNDYGLYVKRGNKTPELYSVKQNGGLEFYVNFDFAKNELDLNYNTYKVTPQEDIKFGVYTINGYGLKNYYDEQSTEMSYHKVPKAETGDKVSVEKTAAVVKCTYEGCMFWGMPCGIEYGYEGIIERGIVTAEFDGEQEIHLTDLTPGKTYSYRAYYEKDGVPIYGVYKTFKTKEDEKPAPVAKTGEHYNETSTTATIECTYKYVPNNADCGYYISKSYYENASRSNRISVGIEWDKVSVGRYEGLKTINLDGLMPDEEYQYYAYISVGNEDVAIGTTKSFTTKTPIANITGEAQTTITSATVGYGFENVPDGGNCQLILLKVGDALENAKFIPVPNKDYGQYTICDLEESSSYSYFFRIEYKTRKWDSEVGSFTTQSPAPIAITGDCSNISKNSATVFCTYKNVPEGGLCGVEYTWNGGWDKMSACNNNGTQSILLTELSPGTIYTYCAYIEVGGVVYRGEDKTFITEETYISNQIEYYSISSEQLNGWDEGVACVSSGEEDFYIVSKTDTIEADGGKVRVCINSFENDDVSKTVIFNYDANGNLYDIIYYGIQFKAEIVSDSMMFVAYNNEGKYLGNFSVPYDVIEVDYSAGLSRRKMTLKQPFQPFWLNSRGEISIPKIMDFGQKANAVADLYGMNAWDATQTAINIGEGKYGDILKDFLIGAFVGLVPLPWWAAIIAGQAASGMANNFYEQEKANYLGNARIEITSIKRTDNKHITVKGILTDIPSIPETYSISSNVYGQSWPNIVYWGVAESKSGQPGYFLNDECSGPLEIAGDNFTYTFYIPEAPGKTLYFRPFLVPKAKLDEIDVIPNPFTCIRYGERKEFMDFNIELSNFKQTKCQKKDTGYKIQFTIDGRIPGVFNDLSGWGLCVKTKNGAEQRYYAKESNDYYPPTGKSFICDLIIDESEIVYKDNKKEACITITPFYSLWNGIGALFLDDQDYCVTIEESEIKVITVGHSDVTETTATLKGKIEGDFPDDVQDGWVGFYINKTGFPQASNARLFRASAKGGEGNSSQAVDGYMWDDDDYFYGYPEDLESETKYYYRAVVILDGIEYLAQETKEFTTKKKTLCPDGNHPHMIDLGLPSGTKWACCNIGADRPSEYGSYFSWGEIDDKYLYGHDQYQYNQKEDNGFYSYTNIGTNICGNNKYDAASAWWWWDDWRMPTTEQVSELLRYTTFEYHTLTEGFSSIIGHIVTGPNGKQIFLPFGGQAGGSDYYSHDDGTIYFYNERGFFWVGETGNPTGAYAPQLQIIGHKYKDQLDDSEQITQGERYRGRSVRAVIKK